MTKYEYIKWELAECLPIGDLKDYGIKKMYDEKNWDKYLKMAFISKEKNQEFLGIEKELRSLLLKSI